MKVSLKTGFSFGLTSAIITTLGLIVGLQSGTHSQVAVIGGILTIAIADAFSDSLGIHISQEAQNQKTPRQIWEATLSTFLAKFVFAFLFIFPFLFFELTTAVILSVAAGLLILSLFSYFIGRQRKADPWKMVSEHLLIALAVILISSLVGTWIASVFN